MSDPVTPKSSSKFVPVVSIEKVDMSPASSVKNEPMPKVQQPNPLVLPEESDDLQSRASPTVGIKVVRKKRDSNMVHEVHERLEDTPNTARNESTLKVTKSRQTP